VLVGTAATGSAAVGEVFALIAWPLLLSAIAMLFMLRLARRFGSEDMLLPVTILGGAALHFTGIFAPGAIDHHNVQLALLLAVVALIADGGTRASVAAGACASLMLAVGMETAPLVALAGLYVAAAFLLGGEDERRSAQGFGLGFAATASLAFAATIAPSGWNTVACDAYSVAQMSLATIGGAGLALATSLVAGHAPRGRKLLALALVGAVAAGVALIFFRDCLGDPYAGLDPRLKTFWLSSVTEALPVWTILSAKPAMAPAYYATPLLGLAWLAIRAVRGGPRPVDMLVAAFLGVAVLLSFWQVRGAMFSIPLAAIPLSAWSARTRAAARAKPSTGATLNMAAAWFLSLNMAWSGAADQIAGWLKVPGAPQAERLAGACYAHADYDTLAALPATTVLAVSNLGAPILRNTHHRALAGPYHRNVEGNLLALDAFMGTAVEAEAIARENNAGLVAVCPGNDETGVLAAEALGGFIADLGAGRLPDWLEPVPGAEKSPLKLYRTGFAH
jgi:hypothetical protein